jgi:hypothetical protein
LQIRSIDLATSNPIAPAWPGVGRESASAPLPKRGGGGYAELSGETLAHDRGNLPIGGGRTSVAAANLDDGAALRDRKAEARHLPMRTAVKATTFVVGTIVLMSSIALLNAWFWLGDSARAAFSHILMRQF